MSKHLKKLVKKQFSNIVISIENVLFPFKAQLDESQVHSTFNIEQKLLIKNSKFYNESVKILV